MPDEQSLRTEGDGSAGSVTRENHRPILPTRRTPSGPQAAGGTLGLWANLAKGANRTGKVTTFAGFVVLWAHAEGPGHNYLRTMSICQRAF